MKNRTRHKVRRVVRILKWTIACLMFATVYIWLMLFVASDGTYGFRDLWQGIGERERVEEMEQFREVEPSEWNRFLRC